ncbi:hypothetical protein WJX84_005481 [Apatococcus fuscideae]|uniref:Secreted protein n=1 Tax=Apatococcus fuscideae TaxID=2026836 RepID=A0AAW1SNW1_9CHLO
MLLAATSTQIWVTAGSSLALVAGSLAITLAGSYLIRGVAQEDPQVFDIDTSERPKRRRINMLRKEQTQESGSSGYRRIPPEPLEMQEKREHESDNLS